MAKRRARRGDAGASFSFGSYRATADTLWRPAGPKFDPRFETSAAMLAGLRSIERADHDLAASPIRQGTAFQRVRREMLARNAFATASIEGNPLTLPEVEHVLRASARSGGDVPDEIEILNFAAFMEGLGARKAPRTPADVLAVHAALFRDLMDDAGAWKKKPNFIGRAADRTVVYVPTPPERVEDELSAALRWVHEAETVHPVVRALLFHHEFESIHPFRDGNGRVGRALTPMILHEFGYHGIFLAPLDHQIYKTRSAYYENLAIVEQNGFRDHTPWLTYMLAALATSYADAVESLLFQRALPESLADRPRALAEWFARLSREEAARRVKFAEVRTAFVEVPERTLKRDLAALRDAGVLESTGQLKGTTYRLRDERDA